MPPLVQLTPLLTGTMREIKQASNADMKAIMQWLEAEDEQGVDGNFLCNWQVIAAHQAKSDCLVCIEGDHPIGFFAGGLTLCGILQVRNEFRGTGVGSALVDRAIKDSISKGSHLLVIECAPIESLSFWESKGFTRTSDDEYAKHIYATRILKKTKDLPQTASDVDVEVRIFPGEKIWEPKTLPESIHRPRAKRSSDGLIHLSESVLFFSALPPRRLEDPAVEILVEGKTVFLEKAKRPSGQDMGIQPCENGYQINSLKGV